MNRLPQHAIIETKQKMAKMGLYRYHNEQGTVLFCPRETCEPMIFALPTVSIFYVRQLNCFSNCYVNVVKKYIALKSNAVKCFLH